jgi:TM2 domain-containing membrane protein YozV
MYTVIGMDGREYGPVDMATLLQWVNEKRVLPGTMVRDVTTGQVRAAGQMPALQAAFSGPPMIQPTIGFGSPYTIPSSAYSVPMGIRDKRLAAGICGILLGAFGVHKFIIGQPRAGAIMLATTILGGLLTSGLAAIAMNVIGIIEGVFYLTKSDATFYNEYIIGGKAWF